MIELNRNAREALMEGIEYLNASVSITLGPKGRNVVIEQEEGIPHVTKDGITVARAMYSDDVNCQMGIDLVRQASQKTCELAGDGTTTSVVLAHTMIKNSMDKINEGVNPVLLNVGIDLAVKKAVELLKSKFVTPVGKDLAKIRNIATISANNDPYIGNLIANTFKEISKDGSIIIEDSKNYNTYVEVNQGLSFDTGYYNSSFKTNIDDKSIILDKTLVLAESEAIKDIDAITSVLQYAREVGLPIILLAPEFSSNIIDFLLANKLQGTVNVIPVRAPGINATRKSLLQDIKAYTGVGLAETNNTIPEELNLGIADKVVIKDNNLVILKPNHVDITSYVDSLKARMDDQVLDVEKTQLKDRIANLIGGVATLYVGGLSESEIKEKKDRIEDAIEATKAAITEGVSVGGGMTYFNIATDLMEKPIYAKEDIKVGYEIVVDALNKPLDQLCRNAGFTFDTILGKILDVNTQITSTFGYNFANNNVEDLVKSGIIDPAKVIRVAIENSAAITKLVNTIECIIPLQK